MKKPNRVLLAGICALALSTGAVARGTVPVVDFEDVKIVTGSGKPLTAEEAKKAITFAATTKGWTITGEGPDKMQATLNMRRHSMSVDIGYTPAGYSIRYADSKNMSYELGATGPTIHPSYNVWVGQLKQAIDIAFRVSRAPGNL